MSNWKAEDFGQYVEVVPINDIKSHYAGDECWCEPEVERVEDGRPVITHNQSGALLLTRPDSSIHLKVNEWMLEQGFTWEDEEKMTWHKYDEIMGHVFVHQSAAKYYFAKASLKEGSNDE